MDEKNILIGSTEFHADRRRKRHIFVFSLFIALVFFSYLLILATSMGDVQSNSLVRNSQIINSSIIINVFVNAKNDTEMIPSFVFPIEVPDDNVDPLWDVSDNSKGDYQKIDTGLLMIGKEIGDRYYRPNPAVEMTTDAPN